MLLGLQAAVLYNFRCLSAAVPKCAWGIHCWFCLHFNSTLSHCEAAGGQQKGWLSSRQADLRLWVLECGCLGTHD